jgi:hypothetical protein
MLLQSMMVVGELVDDGHAGNKEKLSGPANYQCVVIIHFACITAGNAVY